MAKRSRMPNRPYVYCTAAALWLRFAIDGAQGAPVHRGRHREVDLSGDLKGFLDAASQEGAAAVADSLAIEDQAVFITSDATC